MTFYHKNMEGTSYRVNWHKNRDSCSITIYGDIPRDIYTYVDGADYMYWANDICIRLNGEGEEKVARLQEFMEFIKTHHKDSEMLIREGGKNMHPWEEYDEWEW